MWIPKPWQKNQREPQLGEQEQPTRNAQSCVCFLFCIIVNCSACCFACLKKPAVRPEHLDSFTITKTEWNHNNNVPLSPMCWNQELLRNVEVISEFLKRPPGQRWRARLGNSASSIHRVEAASQCSWCILFSKNQTLWTSSSGCCARFATSSGHISLFAAHTRNVYRKICPIKFPVTNNLCAKGPNLLAKGPDFRHICIAFAISCFFEVSKPPGKNNILSGGLMTHLVKLPRLWWSCL